MTIKLQTVSEIINFVSDITNLEGKFELFLDLIQNEEIKEINEKQGCK